MVVQRNLAKIFNNSFLDFLKSYSFGSPVKCFEGSLGLGMGYAASLGFEGEGFVGTTSLLMPEEFLLDIHPTRKKIGPDRVASFCTDWSGEVVNHIVGNMKRLVAPFGVECRLSLPTVLRGKNLTISGVDHQGAHRQWWKMKGYTILYVSEVLSTWEFDFGGDSPEHPLKPSDIVRFDR